MLVHLRKKELLWNNGNSVKNFEICKNDKIIYEATSRIKNLIRYKIYKTAED